MIRWNVYRLTTAMVISVLAWGVAAYGDAVAQSPTPDPYGEPVKVPSQPNSLQQPGSRSFQLELIEVAEDQLSFRKLSVTGNATLTPQGNDALPHVKLDALHVALPGSALSGSSYALAPDYGAGMDTSGGMDPYMGETPKYGMAGGAPPWNGTPAQRKEIEKRITWQAQIDWVHSKLRSGEDVQEAEIVKWKQLIKPVLRSQYLDQLRRQKLQLSVVEKRLEQMSAHLVRRASAVDSVVEFELRRLELQAGGLGMQPDANLKPLTQPATSPGGLPGFDGGMSGGYDGGGGYGQSEGGMF